jgi:nucleoside-diphosphate-sugar epimerase
MTRVLVTGAAGFIGRHAIDPLLSRGFDVHCVSRRHQVRSGVSWHAADLLDRNAASELVARVQPSHLLHLAWETTPGVYQEALGNLEWLIATLGLLRAFHAHGGRRVVAAGSCAEYAWTPTSAPLDEVAAPRSPSTFYGRIKDVTRRSLEAFAAAADLSWAWGVVFHTYGPGQDPRRLVPSAIRALLAGEAVRAINPACELDLLHAADIGGAFAALVASDVAGTVNIASGTTVPVGSVVATLATIVGRPDLVDLSPAQAPGSQERVCGATRRMCEELGYIPSISLADGLRGVVDAWRSEPGKGGT